MPHELCKLYRFARSTTERADPAVPVKSLLANRLSQRKFLTFSFSSYEPIREQMLQTRGDYILTHLQELHSHFQRDVDENFSLLVYDTAYINIWVPASRCLPVSISNVVQEVLYQYIRHKNQEVRNLLIFRYHLITYNFYILKFYNNNMNKYETPY